MSERTTPHARHELQEMGRKWGGEGIENAKANHMCQQQIGMYFVQSVLAPVDSGSWKPLALQQQSLYSAKQRMRQLRDAQHARGNWARGGGLRRGASILIHSLGVGERRSSQSAG